MIPSELFEACNPQRPQPAPSHTPWQGGDAVTESHSLPQPSPMPLTPQLPGRHLFVFIRTTRQKFPRISLPLPLFATLKRIEHQSCLRASQEKSGRGRPSEPHRKNKNTGIKIVKSDCDTAAATKDRKASKSRTGTLEKRKCAARYEPN